MLLNKKNARKVLVATLMCLGLLSLPLFTQEAISEGLRQQVADKSQHEIYHASVLKIPADAQLPVARNIKLGMNKSILVELPVGVRDVLVSNPKIVEAVVSSSRRVYLIGMQIGQANAFLFDSSGEQIMTLDIAVERDTVALKRLLKRLIPGSNIKLELLNDTVILTGSVRNPADSARASKLAARFVSRPGEKNIVFEKKVMNMLTVHAKEQVVLKVTVAEINRNVLKQIGVNLGAQFNLKDIAISALTGNAYPLGASVIPNLIGFGEQAPDGGFAEIFEGNDNNAVQNSGVSAIQRAGANRYGQMIRALERNNIIRTLAEPTLTAISGETAKFLAGGEFPIPISHDNGIGIEYKKFGVGVSFTPTVLAEERISMKISSEVSEISQQNAVRLTGTTVPALETRTTNTTVELPSGGSLMISGLISNKTRENIDGIPGVKDMPILGKLFRSRDYITNETELIVLVTPYLVNPAKSSKLKRPTDGFAPAPDLEALLLGRLNRVYQKPEYGLKDGGDYGFIVE